MTNMPLHSKIGASTCERWWNCPGSVRLVESCPPQPESPYAAEGTAAHEMASMALESGKDACDFVGDFAKSGIEFTDEMAEAVQIYLDAIRFDMETHGLKKENINIEQRFHLVEIDEAAFGTNDCSLPLFLDRIIVYDYKHGKGVVVDVEENKQLMYYALGAAQDGGYQHVEIVIVQPRAPHADGPIRRYSLTIKQLMEFGRELKGKITEVKKPNASLAVGSWCKFCPAVAVCPAIKKSVQEKAVVAFAESPIIQAKRPEEMTDVELRNMLDAIPLIEAWLKAIASYAEQQANRGEAVLGYKLVRGALGHRKWGGEEVAITEALKEIDKTFCPWTTVLKTVPAVEKEIGKKKFVEMKEFITRNEGKVILVPESDPRDAVEPNATQVFATAEPELKLE